MICMGSTSEANIELQLSLGYGMGAGLSGGVGAMYNLYPSLPDLSETHGYGACVGGTGGNAVGGGGDLIFAGEGNELHPIGFGVHAGFEAGAEGHISQIYTWGLKIRWDRNN